MVISDSSLMYSHKYFSWTRINCSLRIAFPLSKDWRSWGKTTARYEWLGKIRILRSDLGTKPSTLGSTPKASLIPLLWACVSYTYVSPDISTWFFWLWYRYTDRALGGMSAKLLPWILLIFLPRKFFSRIPQSSFPLFLQIVSEMLPSRTTVFEAVVLYFI